MVNDLDANPVGWVHVEAVGWLNDEPIPGIVTIRLVDVNGLEWYFEDKVTMFDEDNGLGPNSDYPVDFKIKCSILRIRALGDSQVVDISTASPWGLEATDGTHTFSMRLEDVDFE